MKTITITQVYPVQDKSKDGKPFIDKNGKPFKKISFKTAEYGDRWVSAFAFRDTDSILGVKVGEILDDYVKENGQYLNYSKPTQFELLWKEINKIAERTAKNEKDIEELKRVIQILAKDNDPLADHDEHTDEIPAVENEGIQIEDIPF